VALDLFVNTFQKLRALLDILQTSEDCGEIFDKYMGFCVIL
jgi:hypothetical protein